MNEPVLLIFMILIVLVIFLLGFFFPAQNQPLPKPKKLQKKTDVEVIESFDYHGIKIYQEKGAYNVKDHGRIYHYSSLDKLPAKYKLILKEIEQHSTGRPSNKTKNVMLESNNGKYTFTDHKGQKQSLKDKSELTEKILRIFRGNKK
jgi:hypothetical protein